MHRATLLSRVFYSVLVVVEGGKEFLVEDPQMLIG